MIQSNIPETFPNLLQQPASEILKTSPVNLSNKYGGFFKIDESTQEQIEQIEQNVEYFNCNTDSKIFCENIVNSETTNTVPIIQNDVVEKSNLKNEIASGIILFNYLKKKKK
jgi:hypothetical protein